MFYSIIVIGIWIFISPWILGFASLPAPLWSNIIAGLILIIIGIYALSVEER